MAALAASGNVPLSACGAGCDVSRPFWATDWLPWDSLATSAVEPSASRAGCDVSPLRAIDWLPCGSFATGAIDLSGSGAGWRRFRPLWRSIGFLGTHSPRVQSNRPPAARVATSPRFGRSIGFLAAHSPRVQSTCPAPAQVAMFPVRFGRSIGFLGTHSPRVQSNRPPAARVATSPVRFARPIGSRHSPRAQSNRPPLARASPRFGRSIGFSRNSLATVGGSCACWVIFADGSGDISRRYCSGAITRSCGFCLITIAAPASESTMLSATASDRLACASAGGTTFARLDEALGDRAGADVGEPAKEARSPDPAAGGRRRRVLR